jgi:hypothetical protein
VVVTALQPAEPADPLQRAFDDVTVPTQPGRRLDPAVGDPRNDPPGTQRPPAGPVVVALVGVQFSWPLAGPVDRVGRRAGAVEPAPPTG